MTTTPGTIPASEALPLESLIAFAPGGIASRVLAKNGGGNLTLFAFDRGQGLSEHTTPFDAMVMVLDGEFALTIGGIADAVDHAARAETGGLGWTGRLCLQ